MADLDFLNKAVKEIKERIEAGKVVAIFYQDSNSICDLCDKERDKIYLVSFPEYTQEELDKDIEDHGSYEGYYENMTQGYGTTCIAKLRKALKVEGVDYKKIKQF